MPNDYQFGITQAFKCNYLPEQEERLLVAVDERLHNTEQYSYAVAIKFIARIVLIAMHANRLECSITNLRHQKAKNVYSIKTNITH